MCRCVLRWVISPLYFFRFFYASGRNVRYSPPPILSAVSPASRLAKRGRAHLSGFAQEPQLVRNNNICHGALWAFGNKASIDPPPPPNEPAQQSLLSDLYLSESGGRKAALSAHSSAFVGPSIVWSEPCASSGMPRIRKYWDLFFLVSRDDKQVEICLTAGRKHGFFIRGDAFHFPY